MEPISTKNNSLNRLYDLLIKLEDQETVRELLKNNPKADIEPYINESACLAEKHQSNKSCTCGQCDGTGLIHTPSGTKWCFQSRVDIACKHFQGWGDFRPLTLDHIIAKPGFKSTATFEGVWRLREAINEKKEPQGLILSGPCGCSKTLPSSALIFELLVREKKACALRFPSLIDLYKRGFDGRYGLSRAFNLISGSDVVFIDEVGREGHAGNEDHARMCIDRIVSLCYRQKFLIMATNLTLKKLKEYFSGNVASRLSRHGDFSTNIEEEQGIDLRSVELGE